MWYSVSFSQVYRTPSGSSTNTLKHVEPYSFSQSLNFNTVAQCCASWTFNHVSLLASPTHKPWHDYTWPMWFNLGHNTVYNSMVVNCAVVQYNHRVEPEWKSVPLSWIVLQVLQVGGKIWSLAKGVILLYSRWDSSDISNVWSLTHNWFYVNSQALVENVLIETGMNSARPRYMCSCAFLIGSQGFELGIKGVIIPPFQTGHLKILSWCPFSWSKKDHFRDFFLIIK